jgi:hypothetical protein
MMGRRVLPIPQEISQQVSTTDEFAYLHRIKQHGGLLSIIFISPSEV